MKRKIDGVRGMTFGEHLMEAARSNLSWMSALAAMLATLLGLGPCASKDYALQAAREAKASSAVELVKHESSDRESRDALRAEIKELRADVRALIDAMRSCSRR